MASWFDDVEAADPELSQLTGGTANTGVVGLQTAAPATQTANPQDWLNWINQTYGASASRGSGFADLPSGQNLSSVVDRYNQETGAGAQYVGGASGDKVDFGQGAKDVLTGQGQLWYNFENGAPGGASGGGSAGGGYGGSGSGAGGGPSSNVTLPTAPTLDKLQAPTPFNYPTSTLGQFQAPSQTPTPERLNYTPMGAAPTLNYQQQGTPASLSYQNLPTPANFNYQDYKGPTADELRADPSYAFRLKQGQDTLENSAASKGTIRTGNTAKALIDYGQNAASQEYQNVFNRGFAQNQANNQGQLGAFQTNAQTGLAYNQNANQNALNFGQANIGNQFNATQANNAANLAYGNQNFQNAFAVNQANNTGQNAATQANNQNALTAQGQQFGQAATGYGLNLGAENQGYNQALGAYQTNAGTALDYGQANNNSALANYQAQTNAALGLGNLNLGYQQAANSYDLGQGNLALGQGNLALNQQGQAFNQGLQTFNTNYQTQVADPWNRNFQLASLGNPGPSNPQGYGAAGSDLITGAGNATAAGQVGAGNAWANTFGSLGQDAIDAYAAYNNPFRQYAP